MATPRPFPFEDGAFDVVTSVFGAMFAPDQERTAAEIVRVGKPGGRIGLVAHTPDGFIGELFQDGGPPRPAAGRASHRRSCGAPRRGCASCSASASRRCRGRARFMVFRERSPEACVASWRRLYGPTLKAFEAVGRRRRGGARGGPARLIARFNRAVDGTMVVESEYLATASRVPREPAGPRGAAVPRPRPDATGSSPRPTPSGSPQPRAGAAGRRELGGPARAPARQRADPGARRVALAGLAPGP